MSLSKMSQYFTETFWWKCENWIRSIYVTKAVLKGATRVDTSNLDLASLKAK